MDINITAYVIFLWIAFNQTMGEDIHCSRHDASNKYLSEGFLTFESLGFQQCSKQCLLRSRCFILSYNIPNSTCALGTNDTSLIDTAPSFKHVIRRRSELSAFENVLLKSCGGHSCEIKAICIELSSGRSTCVLECGRPPAIAGANSPTSIDSGLGSRLTYKCKPDHVSAGKSDIMCHPDGHWSTPLLTCTFCDPGNFTFEESLNFCYMVENTTTVIYDDAKTHCSTIGGKLAKLDSPAKVNFMVTITSNASINNIFYVDGNDRSVETVWVYDDGTPVDMALFSSGRPFSNNNTNDCVAFHKKYKSFIDEKCGKVRHFICELASNV